MRIYDCYNFDISKTVKYKDYREYIDSMLKELNLKYKNIIFDFSTFPDKAPSEKFPNLSKYFNSDKKHFCSIGEEWRKGKIYAENDDLETIFKINFKPNRGITFLCGTIIYDQINWYDDENNKSLLLDDDYEKKITTNTPYIGSDLLFSNQIYIEKDPWSKLHIIVIIEATTNDIPRDTTDIVQKLEPYLGKPKSKNRICKLSKNENIFNINDVDKCWNIYKDKLQDSFNEERKNSLYECTISNLIDKKKLKKAFSNTHFEFANRNGLPLDMNKLFFINKYNMIYEIYFQRIHCCNEFRWWLEISGYNFNITDKSGQDFGATTENEVENYLQKIASFCEEMSQDDNYNELLLKTYGVTPSWYKYN